MVNQLYMKPNRLPAGSYGMINTSQSLHIIFLKY